MLWIKDPLAILATGAERGVIVEDGEIIALVPTGETPDVPSFDAGAHVVLPGLINTHHHFYQTLTRASPAALDRELNDKAYILPGLGDAGDRLFGTL